MQRRWAKVLAALALLSFMSLGAVGVAQAAKGEPMSEEERFEKWCDKRQAQGKDCEKDDDDDGGTDPAPCPDPALQDLCDAVGGIPPASDGEPPVDPTTLIPPSDGEPPACGEPVPAEICAGVAAVQDQLRSAGLPV